MILKFVLIQPKQHMDSGFYEHFRKQKQQKQWVLPFSSSLLINVSEETPTWL